MNGRLSLRDAAVQILREHGPLHYRDLTQRILDSKLAHSDSATPEASVNAVIAVDIKRRGKRSEFVRLQRGVFAAREPGAGDNDTSDTSVPSVDSSDQRVRTGFYPTNSELRTLVQVWAGRRRSDVTGLRAAILELRGTPQAPVNWSDPGRWIQDRLSGAHRELAQQIWTASKGTANPRYTYGSWLLANNYGLLETTAGDVLELTTAGRDFLDSPSGETVATIDEFEGLLKLLALVADNSPARTSDLLDEWSDYLTRRSPFSSESTFNDTLRRRLANLLDRDLIERNGRTYSISPTGLAYLHQVGDEETLTSETLEIQTLVREQAKAVRESLRDLLLEMDPFAFEHLIKRLLEAIGYQNVEVTSPSGDGGVDVIGEIELGITSVREVVQVKRHRRTIQRKDLDALRGSLYRFSAVRGTIVTTSRFTRGTMEAAFAPGAAPITLIDGDRLIDLLVENGIGVRRRPIELLELEPDDFQDEGE